MSGTSFRRVIGVITVAIAIQVVFQYLPVRGGGGEMSLSWPDDAIPQVYAVVLLALLVALLLGYAAAFRRNSGSWGRFLKQVASGLTLTLPLLVPVFVVTSLTLLYGIDDADPPSSEQVLMAAITVALVAWLIAAIWRGMRSTAAEVAPALYEHLRTDFLALADTTRQAEASQADPFKSVKEGDVPPPTDGPLPANRLASYLDRIDQDAGFTGAPDTAHAPGTGSWNSGAGYLELQRRLDYARDSLVAHETDKTSLAAHANTLELRLAGAHLPEATGAVLNRQLAAAKTGIATGTVPATHAPSLYAVAAALSSYTYDRQRSLLYLQAQQHWLVVVAQVIAGAIFALAVLAGASREALAAAIVFSLVGSLSGIVSLLHVRQSGANLDLGEDYGLFRVELARAFTLSGLVAVMAVFLMSNLSVLAGTGVFDPPTPTAGADQGAASPVAVPATEENGRSPAARLRRQPGVSGPERRRNGACPTGERRRHR